MAAVHTFQAYQRHITSEFLADRYPYLEDITGHLKADDVTMAFGDRFFPRLVEILETPGMAPEKLIEALRTIRDFSSHQEMKCQAISADAIAAATGLLMHESIPVRRDAARVITALSLLMGGRGLLPLGNTGAERLTAALDSGPALSRLAKLLLTCDDELVKMYVAEAFHAVTNFRDGCQQVVDIGTAKSIGQYLCVTLPELPATRELAVCLLNLLQSLAQVTVYAQEGFRDLLGTGLLLKTVSFLSRLAEGTLPTSEEQSTEITKQALRLLWHFGNVECGRVEILQAGGVAVVTQYLQHPNALVRETAMCTLNVVSLETRGKKEVLEHSLHLIASILHSKDETEYLHRTCTQLVRNAAELPAFRFAFARTMLDSTWLLENMFGTTSLAALSPLLSPKEDLETRKKAAVVIRHFLEAEPQVGDEIRVPPVAQLAYIQHPGAYAYEECMDILPNLASLLEHIPDTVLPCLEAMTEYQAPQKELDKLVRRGKIKIPEGAMEAIVAMCQKDTERAA